MKANWMVISLSLGVALCGCAALSSVEPTDLSDIKRDTPRHEVEAILGEPAEVGETKLGRAAVYIYDRGMEPVVDPGVFAYFMLMPYLWPFAEHEAHERMDKQREPLTVLYDNDDRISFVFTGHRIETLGQVGQGDGEAAYELGGSALHNADKWQWYCLAAHQGHWRTQFRLGFNFQYGFQGFPVDKVKAYLWSSLSVRTGNATSDDGSPADQKYVLARNRREVLVQQMTPDQIAEAERLVIEWTPNPAECAIEGVDTT